MKHIASWLGWWVALFWLWLLLAGEWNQQEWVAAAGSATIGATLGEVARTRLRPSPALSLAILREAPQAVAMVVVDYAILVWALATSAARGCVVRGEFREHEVAGTDAWTALLASISPNAYVVEIDPDSRRVVLHDLVPFEASEKPAA